MKYFVVLIFLFCNSGAGAVTCQILFGNIDIEKSIRALAELRFQLDSSLAVNSNSPSLTAVKSEYDKKEKSLLEHFTKNNYMSKSDFFNLIKREIESLQKHISKTQDQRDLHIEAVNSLLQDGNVAHFNEFKSRDSSSPPLMVMATAITQVLWQSVTHLINSKLPAHLNEADPSILTDHLHPISEVSYNHVQDWINGLNALSMQGEPQLKIILNGHRNGYKYRLPKNTEWNSIIKEVSDLGYDILQARMRSCELKTDVTQIKPSTIQDQNYYGLIGAYRELLDSSGDEAWMAGTYDLNTLGLVKFQIGMYWMEKNKTDHSTTFRLVREQRSP